MEFAASPFEIKALDDSGAIEGLLAGFGDIDRGGDKLLPGCLSKSLASRTTPLPMLLHHQVHRPCGAWKSWVERGEGLFARGEIALGTSDGAEAYKLAKIGALSGLSIGWQPKRTAQGNDGERLVAEAEIFEGSLVAVPMNDRARIIAVKDCPVTRDIAEALEAVGYSGRKARIGAGAAWKAINQQSSDELDDEAEAKSIAILKASTARINAIRRDGP